MPAFFMISGYLYRSRAIKEEMRKIVSQLLFPYLFYGICLIGLFCFIRGRFYPELFYSFLIGDYFSVCGIHPPMCPIWFVLVLINMRVSILIINRIIPRYSFCVLLYISLIISVVIFTNVRNFPNIFMIKTMLLCLPFFIMGYCISQYNLMEKLKVVSLRMTFCLSIFLFLIAIYLGFQNGTVAFIFCTYGYNLIIFYIVATVLTLIWMNTLQRLCLMRLKFIEIISEGTFLIMALHYFMLNTIMHYVLEKGVGIILVAFIALLICMGIILVCRKYFPFALGKSSYSIDN